jgi:predicted nucleic acid-binding Zn ribbon protein
MTNDRWEDERANQRVAKGILLRPQRENFHESSLTIPHFACLRLGVDSICHLSCALAIGYWLSDMRASRLPSAPQSVVSLIVMATYIYETVPESTEIPARRFEVRQSMLDAPLTHDPETGQPVRRVISGGFGLMAGSKNAPSLGSSSHSCGSGHCGCC